MSATHTVLLLLLIGSVAGTQWRQRQYCRRGERCWPCPQDLDRLRNALDPDMPRRLETTDPTIEASAHPIPLPWHPDQPLYGLGTTQMEPLYVRSNLTTNCRDEMTFTSDYCKAQVTNEPQRAEDPDFVVFVLNVEHIRTVLRFARRHRLCIGVAGTGHDFMGRNQPFCDGGSILVRTTLMLSAEADLEDYAGLGHPSFRFGAGISFTTAQKFANDHGMMVACGTVRTVGVAGWTLGGGLGPLTPKYGFGSDNLLAADIVLANGRYVTVTADGPYSDLFRALRGGGGSTWGIITHLTVKAHVPPVDGFTTLAGFKVGPNCDFDATRRTVDSWNELVKGMDLRTTGALYLQGNNTDNGVCEDDVLTMGGYAIVTAGPMDPQVQAIAQWYETHGFLAFTIPSATLLGAVNARTSLLGNYEYIKPWLVIPIAGALVQRNELPLLTDYVIQTIRRPGITVQSLTTSLMANIGSPVLPGDDTFVNRGMRTAITHYLNHWESQENMRAVFGDHQYFAEADNGITDINVAYWDVGAYQLLQRIKRKYDPRGVFGCKGCVSL